MRSIGVKRCAESGFTLPELMAVVLVIGILVAIAVASYIPASGAAAAAACREDRQVMGRAVMVYASAHQGSLSPELDALAPYVRGLEDTMVCPLDDTPLVYDPATGELGCPNHP